MIRPLLVVEEEAVLLALIETDFHMGAACHGLRITERTMSRLLKEWGVKHRRGRGPSATAVFARLRILEQGKQK